MSLAGKIRIGLRREVLILLPVVIVLLVLLSTFTLFSYSGAIELLIEEHRDRARLSASRLAELFGGDQVPSHEELRALAPDAVRLAVVDAAGRIVFARGVETGADPLRGFDGEDLLRPTAVGPTIEDPYVGAIAPLLRAGKRHYLRIDVAASTLARQKASLGPLTWVVLTVNAGLAVLVILFLRHLLTPYDQLLARAREILPAGQQEEDEAALLVASFERALEALKRPSTADEIATLERTLGTSLESGFLLVAGDATALALNRAGAEILGTKAPEEPLPLSDLLSEHRDLHDVICRAITSGSAVQRHELELQRGSARRTLGLSVHPLRRDDGSTGAFLILFADLTETRRRDEEERIASGLVQVGEMAAGVAHEMRNSLATFRGYLTLVERSPEEESIRDYLSELRRETDHLQRVLEDFLSFAQPGSTRFETIDLGVVVRAAARDPALLGHTVDIDIGSRSTLIKGDSQLLERALRNLLLNAVQALDVVGSSGPVEVEVNRAGDLVLVSIADRGPGLPADIQDTLFQPFVTGRSDGVGLGLALAHRIVHLHGGRLELRDRPGGGALAIVEMPPADGS